MFFQESGNPPGRQEPSQEASAGGARRREERVDDDEPMPDPPADSSSDSDREVERMTIRKAKGKEKKPGSGGKKLMQKLENMQRKPRRDTKAHGAKEEVRNMDRHTKTAVNVSALAS